MEFFELILTPKLDNVTLHNSINSSNSNNNNKQNESNTLCITGHHIILSTRKEGTQELWVNIVQIFTIIIIIIVFCIL